MLEERFNGNTVAQAAYNASGVALACMTQCLSMEDYKTYAKREPYVKDMLRDVDLENIWKGLVKVV